MTRLFTEGFEMGDGLFFTSKSGGSISSATKRSGNYAWSIYMVDWASKNFSPAASEFYLRYAFYTDAADNGRRIQWRSGTTILGGIGFNTPDGTGSGALRVYVGETEVMDGSIYCQANTWYLVEAHVIISDTVGVIQVRLDGSMEIDYSGDTKPGTATTANNLIYYASWLGTTVFDDLALNDTNGEEDSGWCGDGHVIFLKPNADSTPLDMTPSTPGTHYTLVDELPANTTDYVSGSVAGLIDTFDIETFTPTGQTITRVWTESRSLDTLAEGGYISLGIVPDGGSALFSGSILQLTSLTQSKGVVHTLNPISGSGWEKEDLDALKVTVRADGV